MKITPFLFAAGALCITAQAQAKQQQRPTIVVVGNAPTLEQWSKHTGKMLGNNLRYPFYPAGFKPNEGIVRVKFQCSDNGAPTSVSLADSSGFHDLDRAALRGVSHIRSLHPLPEGMSSNQRYQAVVLFAADQRSYDRQMAALRNDAARRNAWFGSGSRMAIGISAVPAK